LCIHDARNFDEDTQVLAGDTTNKMKFLGGEEGAALCRGGSRGGAPPLKLEKIKNFGVKS
jgi:hypothetical protein